MGLFDNLVQPGQVPTSGTMSAGLDAGTLMQVRNLIWDKVLPSGRLKTALMATDGSLIGIFNTMKSLISGRKYSQGRYTVGERLVDQIKCGQNISWKDVPDELVPFARLVFTMLFGVKIYDDADFWNLAQGRDKYYNNNPNRLDQPTAAVDRAVYLIQNYFPPSSFNNSCWDVRIFDKYPLVAPVPDMVPDDENQSRGRLYTGNGLNGQKFVNGLLASGPSSGLTQNIIKDNITAENLGVPSIVIKNAPLFAIGLVVLIILLSKILKR